VHPNELHLLEVVADDYNADEDDVMEETPLRFTFPSFAMSGAAGPRNMTGFDQAKLVAFRTAVFLPVLFASIVFFFLALAEGCVRWLGSVGTMIVGPSPAPVMSGENLCYDVIMMLWYTVLLDYEEGGLKTNLHQSSDATGVVLKVQKAEIFSSENKDDFARHMKDFRGTRIVHHRQPTPGTKTDMATLDSARRRKLASATVREDYLRPGVAPDPSGVAVGRVDDPADSMDSRQKAKLNSMVGRT
jgi:hypothetical protein